MKMTYFNMPLDIRHIMEIEIHEERGSFQKTMVSVLREHFRPKIDLFKRCGVVANYYGLETKDLYLRALDAKTSTDLVDLLPQIPRDKPVTEAMEIMLNATSNGIWIIKNAQGQVASASLTQPPDGIPAEKIPIDPEIAEQMKDVPQDA